MRYYEAVVSNPDGSVFRRWASHTNGVFDPGALNVEFDIISATFDNPMGAQAFQIEGVSLQDLTHAKNFTPQDPNNFGVVDPAQQKTFTLKAGMGKGLPLAKPEQAGTITSGAIFQSFGNWQGTEMALNFVITPSSYSPTNPGNIVLNWKAGTNLATAIQNLLIVAYPNNPIPVININPSWVLGHDEIGYWPSIEGFSQSIAEKTMGVLSANDPGVFVSMNSGQFLCFDSTHDPKVIQLDFNDLVGQPTWIATNKIIIKLVMRGDIGLGSLVQLPATMQNAPGMALTSAESLPSNQKYQITFKQVLRVISSRHVGNYRSSDGAAWITILTCIPFY